MPGRARYVCGVGGSRSGEAPTPPLCLGGPPAACLHSRQSRHSRDSGQVMAAKRAGGGHPSRSGAAAWRELLGCTVRCAVLCAVLCCALLPPLLVLAGWLVRQDERDGNGREPPLSGSRPERRAKSDLTDPYRASALPCLALLPCPARPATPAHCQGRRRALR